MSGSIDLKRKRPMEEDYGKTPEEGYAQGEAAATERYRAILRLVRDEQTATAKKNSAEVERNSLSDQIALLEEMLHKGDRFDIRAEKTRLKAELRRAKEDVKAIKVPFVDWEKLGEGWFWSQP
ncbi:hypothetical protein Bca4012_055599 [Brassica carinata]